MYAIRITRGAKTQNWRGIVFGRPHVRIRDGKIRPRVVVGLCTEFEGKEATKAYVSEQGGTWHEIERYWYIPIENINKTNLEIVNEFWEKAIESIEALEDGRWMKMGVTVYISVELPFDPQLEEKVAKVLERKARIHNSKLQVLPGGVTSIEPPSDRLIQPKKPETINGVTIE